jgi:hypothetical protein
MIRAALTFPLQMTDLLTKTILRLPEILRPTSVTLAEDEPATAIGDVDVFLKNFQDAIDRRLSSKSDRCV